MKKQIRIVKGLQVGAEAMLDNGGHYTIGSDASCAVVLYDPKVAAQHCVITLDTYGVTCRAMQAPVMIDKRRLVPGQAATVADFQMIHCGGAVLSLGPSDANWPALGTRAAARVPERAPSYVLLSSLIAAYIGLLGVVDGGSSDGTTTAAARYVATASQSSALSVSNRPDA